MKTRVITAVLAAIMLAVIIVAGSQVYGLFIMVLALIAINELYSAFKHTGLRPMRLFSVIFAAPLAILTFAKEDNINAFLMNREIVLYGGASIYILFLVIFSVTVLKHEKYTINDAVLTFLGGLIITYLFSFLINITYLGEDKINGQYFLILLLLGAWGTDTFAYFSGSFFGKRKLAPDISPKKTIEGSIGGIVGSMLLMALYGHFVLGNTMKTSFVLFMVLGMLCSILSQIGDLIASVIKRHCGIKDYGHLLPGHGGILDRFDSVLFIAPLVYYYFRFFIN
jgi:phosphatidate cytidylyltransferase